MTVQQASVNSLEILKTLLGSLKNEEYKKPLQILSGSAIGSHVRHILEFYMCFLQGVQTGEIDYDARKRNIEIENEIEKAKDIIEDIIYHINVIAYDGPLILSFLLEGGMGPEKINTNIFRELVYNLEHSIHHLAIIKIAVSSAFPHIHLPEYFGISSATIRHKEQEKLIIEN